MFHVAFSFDSVSWIDARSQLHSNGKFRNHLVLAGCSTLSFSVRTSLCFLIRVAPKKPKKPLNILAIPRLNFSSARFSDTRFSRFPQEFGNSDAHFLNFSYACRGVSHGWIGLDSHSPGCFGRSVLCSRKVSWMRYHCFCQSLGDQEKVSAQIPSPNR